MKLFTNKSRKRGFLAFQDEGGEKLKYNPPSIFETENKETSGTFNEDPCTNPEQKNVSDNDSIANESTSIEGTISVFSDDLSVKSSTSEYLLEAANDILCFGGMDLHAVAESLKSLDYEDYDPYDEMSYQTPVPQQEDQQPEEEEMTVTMAEF
mmetsp:Transcript_5631/g.8670  ORF Transcript_5631/g.8670 Transcript_5631/m.8670 type:complete len:153 (+) Transcript_5631:143-601(+)|eukprot:CAMPEP_0195305086 /NCGR_PEP_ID=MMETSP0707-20130614/35637_1 /TAXON_ID=33640 /ORGANISM="Asterionellopsis glacialis, Strain CCMP134" /LENGTH=152 /DNA_ID=CAMNT_0040369103 /DNA_START=96 /DNA_END=554 /DNA_ORIENTATION=+